MAWSVPGAMYRVHAIPVMLLPLRGGCVGGWGSNRDRLKQDNKLRTSPLCSRTTCLFCTFRRSIAAQFLF